MKLTIRENIKSILSDCLDERDVQDHERLSDMDFDGLDFWIIALDLYWELDFEIDLDTLATLTVGELIARVEAS